MSDENRSADSITASPSGENLQGETWQGETWNGVWNVSEFLEIQSIVGKKRAETLLRGYVLHLEKTTASVRGGALDARQLQDVLHDLKSMSGQLGFGALHGFCDRLLAAERIPAESVAGPLLVLIRASKTAAEYYCGRLKAAA